VPSSPSGSGTPGAGALKMMSVPVAGAPAIASTAA
jgi:hypothetical protein